MCIRDRFISIPAYVGSYFLARYTAEKLGNNILNKVTGDIAKQIARQSASSQLGGGAEAEGFNKTLSSLDINEMCIRDRSLTEQLQNGKEGIAMHQIMSLDF